MTTQTFGRYQIKAELGRGGMATVYNAYDPNFERDVAIKVLPPAFLHDPQFRARFEREAKMIALLEHPAIVPVYDFGEQDGQPYIVMRYMAGGSLADRLRDGAMPLDETARLISRLAPALDAAHARSIIHRDLKPGNVLFDQYGNAYLSDFGIARLVEAGTTTLTGENIVGTPAYMSPEQIKGDKAIDGRSDIYAMGVLAYQMLTGRAPYQADTPAKVMMMHVLEPVPDLNLARHDLPPGTGSVLARALAKEPEDRYPSTAEFAAALERSTDEDVSGERTRIAVKDDRTMLATPAGHAAVAEATFAATPRPGTMPPPPAAYPGSQVSIPQTAPPLPAAPVIPPGPAVRRRSPVMALLLIAVLLLGGAGVVGGGLYLMGTRGSGPLAAVLAAANPTATLAPTDTSQPEIQPTALPTEQPALAAASTPTLPPSSPTATDTPTETPTATPTPLPAGPVIGGADKIAYIKDGDVWAANLDGSELVQLTQDGTEKWSLQWAPDGESVIYISGTCIQRAGLAGGGAETITCLQYVDSLKSFDISPDGSQVALTIDNQLYILPFDPQGLSQATNRNHIISMATCADFGPYTRNLVTQVRWSSDGAVLAAKLIANLGGGLQGDAIQLFRVDSCIPNPKAIDNFPKPRFDLRGYDKSPVIQNYDWDGMFLFALNSIVRNDGYGDLYVYNTDLKKAYPQINPINNLCCYRDPHWSPDGTHLLVAFQNIQGGSSSTTQLYLIPYGTIGSGAQYEPLPLPEITNPRERPQPVLRPVQD